MFCLSLTRTNAQTVTDIDGNIYPITVIGKQVWMAENLKTIRLNDGKSILLVPDAKKWKELKTPGYCFLNNDIANKDIYGVLYNWFTVDTKKLCPKGWHVPADREWAEMILFLGDENTAGDKLKEKGNDHWANSLTSATNDFDFTSLGGGMRSDYGIFPDFVNSFAVWWSSTSAGTDAWNRGLYFSSRRIFKGHERVASGFSVRCIKD